MAGIRRWTLVGQAGPVARWLFAAGLVLLPLVYWTESYRPCEPAKRVALVALAALLALTDASWVRQQVLRLGREPGDLALLLLFGWLGLSTLWSAAPGESLVGLLSLASWWLFYLLAAHQVVYPQDVDRVLSALGLGLLATLVLGALQVAGTWYPEALRGAVAPVGLIGNRDWFATYVALLLPVELWVLVTRPSRWRCGLAVANVLLGLPLLALTHCRGAMVAFVAAVALWGLLRRFGGDVARLKRLLAGLVAAAVLGLLALVLTSTWAPSHLVSVWGSMKQQTLESRFLAWRLGWRGFVGSPVIGHGLGSFGAVHVAEQERYFQGFPTETADRQWLVARPFRNAHNDLLELGVEGGAVALLLCLAALHGTVGRFLRAAQRMPEGPDRALSHLFFALAAAAGVASLVGFPFRQTTSAMLVAVFLAGLRREGVGGRQDPAEGGVLWTGAILFGSLGLLGVGLTGFLSDWRLGQGLDALNRGQVSEAEGRLDLSLAMNPWNGRALAAMARVRLEQGRSAEAQEFFARAARHYLDHTIAFNLGVLASRAHDFPGAAVEYGRAARQCPRADTVTALATALLARGDRDGAERLFRLAMEADRGAHEAAFLLAKVLAKVGRVGEALDLLRENVSVIDARRASGDGSGDDALYLVRNLEALEALASRQGFADLVAQARARLDGMQGRTP